MAEARKIDFKVYETETNEEYVLVHVPGAEGEFVGNIRKVCEKELILSNRCVFCQALFPKKSVRIPCFHQGIFPAFGG